MRALIVVSTAAVLLGMAAPAALHAQGSPSADQIIKSLRPTGAMTGSTRGIHAVGTGTASPPQAAATTPDAPATAPAPAAPAAAAQKVAIAPMRPQAAPSVNLTVQFATGSADLLPAAMHTLDELGRALSSPALAAYKFRIEGHTDTVGSRDLNKELSDKRAQAVVSYLASKFNVAPDRMQAVGMGEDGLLVPTPDQTAEPRNRRVQVVNIGT
jgi:outer membrane protein OmpA-like peptidoglycan-associated protein